MITGMIVTQHPRWLESAFTRIVRFRWPIVCFYVILAPFALKAALSIPSDSAIERMIVASNPDVVTTRQFERLFPELPEALLLVESADPFSRKTIDAAWALEAALAKIPSVSVYSAAGVLERMRPGTVSRPGGPEALREFVSGTTFFREQGLVTPKALGLVLALDVKGQAARDAALKAIDRTVETVQASDAGRAGIGAIRRVGRPWLDSWLEHETGAATIRYFPIFGVFVIVLTFSMYRSARALLTILASLGVAVLCGVAFAGVAGFGYTIVSSLVPLTLMITASANLVYLHSRFVDQAPDLELEQHRVVALANKFVAVTVSNFAAGVGFAALAVSDIVPIRQLGLWTAAGIGIGWIVCFTLYPSLQTLLRAPTRRHQAVAGQWMVRAAEVLPRWSYRWRWVLPPVGVLLAAAGLAALVGVPGLLPPMKMQSDALDYADPNLPVVRDTRAFTREVLGRTTASVWITVPEGSLLRPETIGAIDALSRNLRSRAEVGSVVGLPSILGLRRYAAGQGDGLPSEPAALARATGDLEQLLLTEPMLGAWVDMATLGSTYLRVTSRAGDTEGIRGLEQAIRLAWTETAARVPALSGAGYKVVGLGVLEAHISEQLVPTLAQSFALTFGVIFFTFLIVFRSGPARLIATVPSIFAILVMFLVMRLTGIGLNVATILIATAVLGATENDQVHFFFHFQEGRATGTTEQAVSHAIRVAGHAIVFATVINAGGFLALVMSSLPPMRQFGILTALAFALALLADFTALLSGLWVVFGDRPEDRAL